MQMCGHCNHRIQQHSTTPTLIPVQFASGSLNLWLSEPFLNPAASINWEEWITARLKRAAARRVGNSSSINATIRQQHARTAQQLKPAARHANVSLRTPSKTAAHQPAGKSGFSSGRSSTADAGLQAAPQAHEPLVYWQVGKSARGTKTEGLNTLKIAHIMVCFICPYHCTLLLCRHKT
jgi:hypothetical protein